MCPIKSLRLETIYDARGYVLWTGLWNKPPCCQCQCPNDPNSHIFPDIFHGPCKDGCDVKAHVKDDKHGNHIPVCSSLTCSSVWCLIGFPYPAPEKDWKLPIHQSVWSTSMLRRCGIYMYLSHFLPFYPVNQNSLRPRQRGIYIFYSKSCSDIIARSRPRHRPTRGRPFSPRHGSLVQSSPGLVKTTCSAHQGHQTQKFLDAQRDGGEPNPMSSWGVSQWWVYLSWNIPI